RQLRRTQRDRVVDRDRGVIAEVSAKAPQRERIAKPGWPAFGGRNREVGRAIEGKQREENAGEQPKLVARRPPAQRRGEIGGDRRRRPGARVFAHGSPDNFPGAILARARCKIVTAKRGGSTTILGMTEDRA